MFHSYMPPISHITCSATNKLLHGYNFSLCYFASVVLVTETRMDFSEAFFYFSIIKTKTEINVH